jgi:tape measure domain-containing protein
VALASVKLELLTGQAERSARRLQDRTNELSKRFRDVKNRSNAAGNRIQKFGRQSAIASRGVNRLGASVRKLLTGLALLQSARFIIGSGAQLETQRRSLEVLTGSLVKTNEIIKELQAFGAVTPFKSSELIDTAKRLKAFGFETDKIVDVTKRLGDIAGATGSDLNGIATAFGQIQAKGKLQQEENLQLLERGVDITSELKKITGLQGTEFESAMRKGKISSELVNQALINLTETGGQYAGGAVAQSTTLAGKFSTLIDNIERLAQKLSEVLEPALKKILDTANRALGAINKLLSSQFTRDLAGLRAALGFSPGGTFSDLKNIQTFAENIQPLGLTPSTIDEMVAQLRGTKEDIIDVVNRINQNNVFGRPFKLTDSEEEQRTKTQVALTKKINDLLERKQVLLKTNQNIIKETLGETDKAAVKWEQIRETIASGLTSAVEGLIAGTKTLGEALAGIAKSIASMYLKAAFMNMLPGLPGKAEGGYMANGIKPFASGGMATRPTLGLVGEAGEDEYIIPASKMASSMQRYSAGARGEAVIPGTGSSYAGGGAGGSTTVNYSGPILNFNSEEFVPKSAVGQIIATATSQGAKAGENRTLSTLRNSRSARSRLGM